MTCVICRQGETSPGTVTVTLTRGPSTLVVKGVPALVCDNCGEEYIEAETSTRLTNLADTAVRAGVEVDVRTYAAA